MIKVERQRNIIDRDGIRAGLGYCQGQILSEEKYKRSSQGQVQGQSKKMKGQGQSDK
jgi:hypothetical protein